MHNIEHQYIQKLFELGHFYNPNTPNGHNVKVEHLTSLNFQHPLVKDALRSFQEIGGEVFNNIVFKHHGRAAVIDGSFGPATNQLFNTQRCACPDYILPLVEAGKGAIGTGSWPMPCQKEGIKIHIDKSRQPSVLVARWPEIQRQVFAAYHKLGANVVEVASASEAHIRVWWESLAGSTIGIAQFNSRSCGSSVWCKLDTGYTDLVAILWCHELGHNMNLEHTSGGVMNPFIINVTELWAKNDPSYNTLVRFFGGEPLTPPPPSISFAALQPPIGTSKIEIDFPQKELRVTVSNLLRKFVLLDNTII